MRSQLTDTICTLYVDVVLLLHTVVKYDSGWSKVYSCRRQVLVTKWSAYKKPFPNTRKHILPPKHSDHNENQLVSRAYGTANVQVIGHWSRCSVSRHGIVTHVLVCGIYWWRRRQWCWLAKAVVTDSARMLTGRPLQSLSLSLSQLFLLLPLRPRVPQTDGRWAAARVECTASSLFSSETRALFSAFFLTVGGKGGSDVGWGGGKDHIPY